MTTTETVNIVAMDFAEIEVRVVALFGQPWFVGADLRRVLATADAGSFYRGRGADEMMNAPTDSIRALNSAKGSLRHGAALKSAKLVSESGLL